MSVRRLIPVSMAGAVAALAIVSCGQRSLIVMQVESAAPGVTFSDVNLVIRARQEQTRFDGVSFGDATSPLRAGLYLSSDISGSVVLSAEVDDPRQNCVVGMGTLTVSNVSPGNTVGGQTLLITAVVPCVPVTDGGSVGEGGSNATGGSPATGGTPGTGGHGGSPATGGTGGGGPAGSRGSGGSATGGSAGSGGMKATGGTTGSGGMGASGGMTGTGGIGGTAGLKGSGGMTGAGGMLGSGGMIGAGGMVGAGGVIGSGGVGGSGGVVSSGGMPGSGGSPPCKCPNPNEICDSAGGCVCSQTAADACAGAGYECGTTTDICGGSVSCGVCPINFICSGGVCLSRCTSGTGGIVAASPDIICPVQTQ